MKVWQKLCEPPSRPDDNPPVSARRLLNAGCVVMALAASVLACGGEALQTTAMLLAEMIASGELQSIAKSTELLALNGPVSIKGAPVADGVGLGHVLLHEPRDSVQFVWSKPIRRVEDRSRRRVAT